MYGTITLGDGITSLHYVCISIWNAQKTLTMNLIPYVMCRSYCISHSIYMSMLLFILYIKYILYYIMYQTLYMRDFLYVMKTNLPRKSLI